jgi:hypothetical protein
VESDGKTHVCHLTKRCSIGVDPETMKLRDLGLCRLTTKIKAVLSTESGVSDLPRILSLFTMPAIQESLHHWPSRALEKGTMQIPVFAVGILTPCITIIMMCLRMYVDFYKGKNKLDRAGSSKSDISTTEALDSLNQC